MNKNVNPESAASSRIIEAVGAYFKDKEQVRLVLVYGSVARGRFTDASDVDIAVAGRSALDPATLFSAQAELSGLLGRSVDLIDLHRVEGLILFEAVVHGVKIKLDRELFVKFHTKALIYKEDFQPLQRMMQDARIKRFIDGSRRSKGEA